MLHQISKFRSHRGAQGPGPPRQNLLALLHQGARGLQNSAGVVLLAAAVREPRLIVTTVRTNRGACRSAILGMSPVTVDVTTIGHPLRLARRLLVLSAPGTGTGLGIELQSGTNDARGGVPGRPTREIADIAPLAHGAVGLTRVMQTCPFLGELRETYQKYRSLCSRNWIGEWFLFFFSVDHPCNF